MGQAVVAYTIKIKPSVLKTLAKIESAYIEKIRERIRLLAVDPYHNGSIKLSGTDAYRTRVGKYRIVYEIQHSEVLVHIVNVDHRKDIYR